MQMKLTSAHNNSSAETRCQRAMKQMSVLRFGSAVILALFGCATAPLPSTGGWGGIEGLQSVRVNGVELHYVERGSGEPIVFVHGSLADYREWASVIEDLSPSFRTIAYSRRYNYPNKNPI